MESLALPRIEREAEDYRLPYEETDALIERGLIKVILPKGEVLDENAIAVKADLSGIESKRKDDSIIGEEETEEISENEENVEDSSEENEENLENSRREVEIRYRRSFLSRYVQAESYIQDYYTEIKNELLSYKGVKARTSWSKESFKCGRTHIAKIDVKGKALCLYLAINPESVDAKYRVTKAKGDCPTLIKIKSDRKKKYALELIRTLMESLALPRIEREAEDYRLPYEETDALIERGLIKVILPKGEVLDENAIAVKADLSGIESKRKENAEPEEESHTVTDETVNNLMQTVEVEEKPLADTENEEETDIESELFEEKSETVEEKTENATEIEEDFTEIEEGFTETEPLDVIEKMAEVEDDDSFDSSIDALLDSMVDGRATIVLNGGGSPLVKRGIRGNDEKLGFSFSDGAAAPDTIVIPYTRAEYLALPRKKKKSVLMSVKKLLRYSATKRLCEALRSLNSKNERILMRIAKLEERLLVEERFLPTAKLWENAVKRLKK